MFPYAPTPILRLGTHVVDVVASSELRRNLETMHSLLLIVLYTVSSSSVPSQPNATANTLFMQ